MLRCVWSRPALPWVPIGSTGQDDRRRHAKPPCGAHHVLTSPASGRATDKRMVSLPGGRASTFRPRRGVSLPPGGGGHGPAAGERGKAMLLQEFNWKREVL